MTTFTPRTSILAEALFGASHNLSMTEAINAADRVLMDSVQESVVESFARLVDSLAEAAKGRDLITLTERIATVHDVAQNREQSDTWLPESHVRVAQDLAAAKRQAELS